MSSSGARSSNGNSHLLLQRRGGVDQAVARARRRGYGETLAEHRRVLRDAFAAHGGVEVDTQGDAFFVVFPKAPEAVAAAYAAQEALASAFLALTGSARHSAFAHAGVSLARSSDRPHGSGVDVLDLSLLRSTALLEHCFKVCSRPVEPLPDSLPGGRMAHPAPFSSHFPRLYLPRRVRR